MRLEAAGSVNERESQVTTRRLKQNHNLPTMPPAAIGRLARLTLYSGPNCSLCDVRIRLIASLDTSLRQHIRWRKKSLRRSGKRGPSIWTLSISKYVQSSLLSVVILAALNYCHRTPVKSAGNASTYTGYPRYIWRGRK